MLFSIDQLTCWHDLIKAKVINLSSALREKSEAGEKETFFSVLKHLSPFLVDHDHHLYTELHLRSMIR